MKKSFRPKSVKFIIPSVIGKMYDFFLDIVGGINGFILRAIFVVLYVPCVPPCHRRPNVIQELSQRAELPPEMLQRSSSLMSRVQRAALAHRAGCPPQELGIWVTASLFPLVFVFVFQFLFSRKNSFLRCILLGRKPVTLFEVCVGSPVFCMAVVWAASIVLECM